jgi:hypothetical protein
MRPRLDVVALATVHALGMAGAPFAAKLHLFQPGATAHQNFHVVWEAFKYFTASALAFAIVVGPYARGERWAERVLWVASVALFGGVFVADAITRGAPSIDHWAYGTFLVVSVVALAARGARAEQGALTRTRDANAPRSRWHGARFGLDAPMNEHDVLVRALLHVLPDPPPWVQLAIAGKAPAFDVAALCFGGAGRELGHEVVVVDPDLAADARALGVGWLARGTNVSELARVILARAIVASAPEDGPRALRTLYVEGDNDERAAIMKALPLLDDGRAYTQLAQEGCRSNVKTVFESIACDNPFPARHFGERPFCQMVLKAVFVGTRVARVEGLRERTTGELVRMARDYAAERRAAGRAVPEDVLDLLAEEGAA